MNKNIVKVLWNKKTICIASFIILLIMLFIGFFGYYFEKCQNVKKSIVELSDCDIYVDGEKQNFRDSDGHRKSPILYKGSLYIPFVDKGLYLEKSVERNSGDIYLMDSELDLENGILIDTITVKGVPFSNDDLINSKYTLFFNWTTWCPDCKALLQRFSEYKEVLEENNIRLVGIPYFDAKKQNLIFLDKEIEEIQKGYDLFFDNIICNKYLSEVFQSNIENIPSIYILDNKGRLVHKDETENISILSLVEKVQEYSSCNEC